MAGQTVGFERPHLINLVELNEEMKKEMAERNVEDFYPEDLERMAKVANVENKYGWSFEEGELAKQDYMSIVEQIECGLLLGFFLGLTFVPVFITMYGVIMMRSWLLPFVVIMAFLGFVPLYHPWPPMGKNWHMFHLIQRYFSMKVVKEAPLSLDKKYLFVTAPHGVFPFANLSLMPSLPYVVGVGTHALVATAVMHCPIFRQCIALLGAIDCSAPIAKNALSQGRSLGIIVGGIAEIFESTKNDEIVVLKKRKGFVKLALQTGTAMIPVYAFGNTEVLSCIADPWGILQRISRKLKFSLTIPFGRFFLPIPRHVPLAVVMGKPIEVPVKTNPTNEEIDHYHRIFVEEITNLFNRHKAAYGWKHKKLIIAE